MFGPIGIHESSDRIMESNLGEAYQNLKLWGIKIKIIQFENLNCI
jgi:hypothetical protein